MMENHYSVVKNNKSEKAKWRLALSKSILTSDDEHDPYSNVSLFHDDWQLRTTSANCAYVLLIQTPFWPMNKTNWTFEWILAISNCAFYWLETIFHMFRRFLWPPSLYLAFELARTTIRHTQPILAMPNEHSNHLAIYEKACGSSVDIHWLYTVVFMSRKQNFVLCIC